MTMQEDGQIPSVESSTLEPKVPLLAFFKANATILTHLRRLQHLHILEEIKAEVSRIYGRFRRSSCKILLEFK